jgi:hypothetical protein
MLMRSFLFALLATTFCANTSFAFTDEDKCYLFLTALYRDGSYAYSMPIVIPGKNAERDGFYFCNGDGQCTFDKTASGEAIDKSGKTEYVLDESHKFPGGETKYSHVLSFKDGLAFIEFRENPKPGIKQVRLTALGEKTDSGNPAMIRRFLTFAIQNAAKLHGNSWKKAVAQVRPSDLFEMKWADLCRDRFGDQPRTLQEAIHKTISPGSLPLKESNKLD